MIKKGIALSVMLLFVGMMISPSTGNLTPPNIIPSFGVTISFVPPEPDGDNGWYKTCVDVYFMGDNGTIIDYIMIRIDGGSWQTVPGASVYLCLEGITSYDFIAVDTDGGQWFFGPYEFKIDTYPPEAQEISWEAYKEDGIWYLDLTASASDETSGMDRVECFIEDEHYETIEGAGPDYVFTFKWSKMIWGKWIYFYHYDKAGNEIVEDTYIPEPDPPPTRDLIGIICDREISEKNVSFFAIVVFEPLSFKPFILEQVIFPNNYTGYIGRFFIRASFYDWYT